MPHFANLSFSQIRLHLKYKNEKKRGQQRKKIPSTSTRDFLFYSNLSIS